jgi:hypothetical protein
VEVEVIVMVLICGINTIEMGMITTIATTEIDTETMMTEIAAGTDTAPTVTAVVVLPSYRIQINPIRTHLVQLSAH